MDEQRKVGVADSVGGLGGDMEGLLELGALWDFVNGVSVALHEDPKFNEIDGW